METEKQPGDYRLIIYRVIATIIEMLTFLGFSVVVISLDLFLTPYILKATQSNIIMLVSYAIFILALEYKFMTIDFNKELKEFLWKVMMNE